MIIAIIEIKKQNVLDTPFREDPPDELVLSPIAFGLISAVVFTIRF